MPAALCFLLSHRRHLFFHALDCFPYGATIAACCCTFLRAGRLSDQPLACMTRYYHEIISGNRYLHRLAGNVRMEFLENAQTLRLLIRDIISG